MNKKSIGMLFASTLLVSIPMAFNPLLAATQSADSFQIAANVDDLVDLPSNHWAYNAVKVLVQELEIMDPKTSNQFKGNDLITRYELANVFDRAVKKLEASSGRNLSLISDAPDAEMEDLDDTNRGAVENVVNKYGIMQPMPGKKFMGNEPISRYEIAFELFNYFTLIENQGVSPSLSTRNRSAELKDLPADHWATKAVTAITDKYQIMDGYPDDTFKGGKRLTRYEAAAVIREFIGYVDTYLIPLTPVPTAEPTAVPTAAPTPMPTATPIPEPTKVPLAPVDLRIGGDFSAGLTGAPAPAPADDFGFLYGPALDANIWFPKLGFARFGLNLRGDWQFFDSKFVNLPSGNNRVTAGGGIDWRILGADSAEDFSLVLGVGYDYMQIMGQNYSYANHGPRGKLAFEIPIGGAFSISVRDYFTYFIGGDPAIQDNMTWKNDAFAGITIPAYTLFAVELGYRDIRYMLDGIPGINGTSGGELNLRFRF